MLALLLVVACECVLNLWPAVARPPLAEALEPRELRPPLVPGPANDGRAPGLVEAAEGAVDVRLLVAVAEGARLVRDLAALELAPRVVGGVLVREDAVLVAELSCFVGLVRGDWGQSVFISVKQWRSRAYPTFRLLILPTGAREGVGLAAKLSLLLPFGAAVLVLLGRPTVLVLFLAAAVPLAADGLVVAFVGSTTLLIPVDLRNMPCLSSQSK